MSRGGFDLNHEYDNIKSKKELKLDEIEFERANEEFVEPSLGNEVEDDETEGFDPVALMELAGTFMRPEEAIEVDVPHAATRPNKKVSFGQLYRFADGKDWVLMVVGFFCAIIQGLSINAVPYITGTVINEYISTVLPLLETNSTVNGTCTPNSDADVYSNIMSIAAVATRNVTIAILINCASGFTHMACWVYTAERQALTVRKKAFFNILHQHTGYFDKHQSGEINSILADDASRFQAGIGDKVGLTIHWLTVFLGATTISLIKSWQVTLCTLAIVPIALLSGALASMSIKKSSREEAKAYAMAGGVAEEALANIRIVTAFAGQDKERERYSSLLKESKRVGIKSAYTISLAQSISWLIVFCVGAVIFWYGGIRVVYHGLAGGNLFMIMLEMISGLRSLSWIGPNIEAIGTAQGSAYGLFELVDVESEINSADESGDQPSECHGRIKFEKIRFSYPAREEVEVLKGLSLEIKPGQTAALVGPSGCGKSTTIQLLQRLYDPHIGGVLVDGKDVREYNLKWLRKQIGVVSQEPVLFAATIEENIRFGRDDATREECMVAAKEADAHDFIMKLPQKYDTLLNEQGTQLSRGEKQRISLARALVRQPTMLLLDEATSALDNESEAVVQAALDKASKGRTTIVIAHRLSTVRDANILFVVDKGVVAELGTHDELMAKKGLYHMLVRNQVKGADTEENPEEEKKKRTGSEASRRMTLVSLKGFRSGSIVPNELEDLQLITKEETMTPVALKRVLEMNKPEYGLMTLGGICAVIIGFVWPIFAYFIGYVINTVTTPCLTQSEQTYQLNLSAISVIVEGALATCVSFTMLVCFKYSGEYLTLRVRAKAFSSMLRQEIGWFDDLNNQVGTLTSKLANEASRVKMSTGSALSSVLSSSSTVILAAAADVVFGWPLGLALIPLMPLTILAAVLQGYFNRTLTQQGATAVENSGRIASEAVDKVRTIASLTKEEFFMAKYSANYNANKARGRKKGYIIGGTWAMLYGVLGLQFILSIGFGLYLVSINMIPFYSIFSILFVTLIASLEMGRANAYMPEITAARAAATNLFALYDRVSLLDPDDKAGLTPPDTNCEITIKDVVFNYPTRPNIRVLDHFHMSAKRGEFIAMCGPSGGGKSTAIQLMERFYDVENDKGDVLYDGRPVKDINSKWLREQMSIVTQEPVLFSWSLGENIAYGDNNRKVPMEEIIAASKAANIHNFIASLPKGYDTRIGNRGNQLSGGQKQRVSIARALVRDPRILLLDDATSALDSASEKVVEEALEKAREGRTAVVVSHRLSSIIKANRIMYVDKGHVLEAGTHDELMSKKAHYYKLQQANLGFKHTS